MLYRLLIEGGSIFMSGTFKDLEVWKAAMELAVRVYRLTAQFPKEEFDKPDEEGRSFRSEQHR